MKSFKYFMVLSLFINVLASCTSDDTVDEAVQSEQQDIIASGDDSTENPDDGEG